MAESIQPKKMNLIQLTFIVAVNMMGSGIIMLPSNMAKVGAISLLSWLVTAVGSMAIAYGFAQAGIFNQRSGGMAAYAEDAYGKSGYFITFLLYFLSLVIGNVAIGISAVGYLAGFFPWLSSTPVATCIGLIILLWLTTVANFGGPNMTGRIGSITVWGVIIPVGLLSIIGWFWFSRETFDAAWNPQGLSLAQGMGSSITLTLWAFLGMESAAQNSNAVENPKRDVPLACLFGTLGAAVIYILSTTVIQGIVPNAELAASTGPFALAYAKMFNPTIGSIIMALAVLACLGSLLGWQFTVAQTGKAAADDRMFPAFFSKTNAMGAPITGMIVLGIVQTLLALSTISPTLNEQFMSLVSLAVVTNVIPYVIALSALPVMMKLAGISEGRYAVNMAVALVAMVYSVFALYASGNTAVMGGMIVLGIAFIIWGFIAPRFYAPAKSVERSQVRGTATGAKLAVPVILLAFLVSMAIPSPVQADALDKIKTAGKVVFGYREDARPFSYQDESGSPAGFSVGLCQAVSEEIKSQLSIPNLTVEWTPVSLEDRFAALQQGRIDVLCAADSITLSRREEVSFSVPIFRSGIGAAIRSNAPVALRDALAGEAESGPIWRGSPARILDQKTIAVVKGTTGEKWLAGRIQKLQIPATARVVDDYAAGIKSLVDKEADIFFADRAILMEAQAATKTDDVTIIDRLFTNEPIALAISRDNDRLRLIVDRTLSKIYTSPEFPDVYARYFGEMSVGAFLFYELSGLAE